MKNNNNISLLYLIEAANTLGLSNQDTEIAHNFLKFNELGLCFDTVITQMYEYDTEITIEFYNMISKIGEDMKIPLKEYDFMKELIRNNGIIPKSIKEQLAKIISSLDKNNH